MTPLPRIHPLGLAAFGAITSVLMVTPVLPLYLDRRGLSPVHVGALVGVMSLPLVVVELLALSATARIGRRASVLFAFAGSTIMLASFPHVVTLWGLYANRMAFGAVRGLLWPVLFSEVADAGPPHGQAVAWSIFWLYFGLGQLIGPALGGWIGDRTSLAMPFYAAAALSLLTLFAAAGVRPHRDATTGNPLLAYRELIRQSPGVTRTWILTISNVTTFSVYATFLPLHAASHGMGVGQIGLIFTAGALAFIAGQDILRRFSDRINPERLLIPAFMIRGLGVLAVPALPSFWLLLVTNALTALPGSVIPNALSARVARESPRPYLVASMGGFNAAADVGFFLGPALGGIVALAGVGWAFGIVLPVTGLALWMLSNHTIRRSATMAANSSARYSDE